MTKGQRRALQELWPRFGVAHDRVIDPEMLFGSGTRCTLEIGFGNGDALLTMAAREPENGFLGIEVHRPGIGRLLLELDRRGIENVRVICADAMQVITDCLPDNSLDRVLLFFPDPWHKQRHHKRRLVQPPFIAAVAARLKPGGILHMATDWQDYAEHMLAVTGACAAFRNCAGEGRYSPRPDYRPVTRFEQRGRRLGHGVRDLLFERVDDVKGQTTNDHGSTRNNTEK
jgi:tRNA (guanine-N7-)-methyltransferase